MSAPRSTPENPTHGLFYVPGDHEVVVTGEEHHQPVLQPYAPLADGRSRRVAVELVPAPVARGKHAGEPGIEVRLDGRRIGELTHLMAGRYTPLVADVLRRGGRPSCIGLVDHGKRGLQVVLLLPDLRAGTAPRPAPAAPQERPTSVLPNSPAPSAPRRRRRLAPLLVGAGVVTVLVVIGATAGGGDPAPAAGSTLAAPTTVAAPPTTPVAPTTTPAPTTTTTTAPPPPPVTQRAVAQPQPQPQPQPRPQPQPEPRPQPRPQPQAAPPPASDCNSNYSGACVPNASDVDCEGGSGNGPAYVRGPVRVTGNDEYGLDSNGDGIGCE
jgi:hypothetical protein